MANLLHRMAGPPSRRQGLQFAVVAVIMTSAPLLTSLLISGFPAAAEGADNTVARSVLSFGSVTGALGLIPLLMAVVALVGRPVKPAWLVLVALVLVLCQPIAWILESTGLLHMLHSTAVLIAIATGCAAGVIAAGLVSVDRDRRIPAVLLIPLIVLFAAGVSIAATVAFMFWSFRPLVAAVIALVLGVDIMRGRKDQARHDVLTPENAA